VHAAILALIVAPTVHSGFQGRPTLGAGGPGPAGGGGGGAPALGDRLRFVMMRQPAPAPATALADVSRVASPTAPPAPVTSPTLPAVPATGSRSGTSGADGEGAGPGSGGGIGSGVGPGRGSGIGPGTGGGTGERHPPAPTQLFLPPLPAPQRIKPYHLIAWFDVDERGNARLLSFNPSRDAGYNRRLREVLLTLRFRPAVGEDGTPVRDTVDIHYIF
jgi:protein TonB